MSFNTKNDFDRTFTNQSGDEICCECNDECICDDREFADGVEDAVPHSDISHSLGHGTPVKLQQLLSVQSHFENVVQQCKEGCERKSCHKDSHESILQNCNRELLLKRVNSTTNCTYPFLSTRRRDCWAPTPPACNPYTTGGDFSAAFDFQKFQFSL
jgi:hypothetical protein